MKNKFGTKLLSLILCVCMLLPILASCTNKDKGGDKALSWETLAERLSCSASIVGTYATGDVNPVITITLDNTVAAAGLTKDMITLTGLFEGLEITGVSGSERTITIVTSGTIAISAPFLAGVDLAEGATNSGVALSAACEVAYRSVYVKQDSFALAGGVLTFDAVVANDTVTLSVNDTLKAEDTSFMVKAVSEDKSTVTLGVATSASDLDAAIAAINGKTLEIPADKTASANAYALTVCAISASVGGSVDYIEATDTANTYSATAILFVKNGVWHRTLEASDITFGGDFDGATITSVAKNGNVYEITFTCVKENLDLDDLALNGGVTISAGKVQNAWGTTLAENDAELTYVTGLDRGQTWDAIKLFVQANKSTFKTIGTVGSAVGGVASAATGVVKILELAGVIESTDAKIDNIKREMQYMNQSLQLIDEKMNTLGQAIATGTADTITAVHKNTYLTASNGWNAFLTSYVTPLFNVMSDYKLAFNTYMVHYIDKAGVSDAVTVYIDENGSVTLPGAITGYSVDGIRITTTVSCSLADELSVVKQNVIRNKGKVYDGYWDDICASQISLVDGNGKAVTNVTVQEYLDALRLDAAMASMNVVGVSRILNTYTNFCYALAGRIGGSSSTKSSIKPLDYYYQMISTFYNFYAEAKEDIDVTHAWLGSLLVESSGLATMAYEYTPGATSDLVSTAYNLAIDEISTNNGVHEDNYSYLAGKNLTVDRVYENFNGADLFLATKANSADKYSFPGSYMSDSNVKAMIARYEQLKKGNVTASPSFAAYLVSLGMMGSGLEKAVVIVSKPAVQNIPMNNSVTLIVDSVNKGADYFSKGQHIQIGNNGDREAEYYTHAKQLMANTISFDGNTENSRLVAYAKYYEDHWYWFNREDAQLSVRISSPLLVFKLS